MKRKKHIGGLLDDFLKEEGIHEEVQATAIKRVLAWQLEQVMKEQKITKIQMAHSMKTSRAQLDRLLDPVNESVTLATLARAAAVVGRKLRIEFV